MEVTIRRCGPEHVTEHRAIQLEMVRDAPTAFWMTAAEALSRTDGDWLQELDERICFHAIDAAGRVIGALGILPVPYTDEHELPEDAVNLVGMYVSPSARGTGVSSALMARAQEHVSAMGRPVLCLDVASSEAHAIRAYERMGFRATGAVEPHPRCPDVVWRTFRRDPEVSPRSARAQR